MESLKTSLLALGLSEGKASKITRQILNDLAKYQPEQCWQLVSKTITKYPFPVQLAVYKAIYPHYEKMPAPAWFPNWPLMKSTNIARLMAEKGMRDYQHDYRAFHHWTTTHSGDFWQKIAALLNIQFDNHYSAPVDLTKGIENPVWFPGAKLNIVNSCLQAKKNKIAIISQTENSRIKKITYEELDKLSNRVANSLSRRIARGDYVAIVMPMVAESVAIFLGIIKAGGIVVAIPDSFSSEELATRLKISNAKIVFCQDHVIRAGKALPLYQRLLDAAAPQTIVVPAENKLTLQLRGQDIEWDSFLATDDVFMPVSATPQDHINILFSSGTTGEPKIIPWTHITPLKCASDAYFHHNLQADNIFCWPTNLGWMMGPWLIFACLLNKATMALFGGSPNTK
ncbi:MAG TPA: AMP-binding protein, partial [Gammaproteobacteria bacterium]|nr:AMP-binding protein [Gammaproteobacteria bacterium]